MESTKYYYTDEQGEWVLEEFDMPAVNGWPMLDFISVWEDSSEEGDAVRFNRWPRNMSRCWKCYYRNNPGIVSPDDSLGLCERCLKKLKGVE